MKTVFGPVGSCFGLLAAAISLVLLSGCAKKEVEPEFRPLQIHWTLAAGESEQSMPTKDNCVIRLTAKLMGEPPVQESPAEEIAYNVTYGTLKEKPGTLYFNGTCSDLALKGAKECAWSATCDESLNVVVKFHNGD